MVSPDEIASAATAVSSETVTSIGEILILSDYNYTLNEITSVIKILPFTQLFYLDLVNTRPNYNQWVEMRNNVHHLKGLQICGGKIEVSNCEVVGEMLAKVELAVLWFIIVGDSSAFCSGFEKTIRSEEGRCQELRLGNLNGIQQVEDWRNLAEKIGWKCEVSTQTKVVLARRS